MKETTNYNKDAEGYRNIEILLYHIEQRPQMYTGFLSLRNLYYFLQGYLLCGKLIIFLAEIDRYFQTEFSSWSRHWLSEKFTEFHFDKYQPWYHYFLMVSETDADAMMLFFKASRVFLNDYIGSGSETEEKIIHKNNHIPSLNIEALIYQIAIDPALYLEEMSIRNLENLLRGIGYCKVILNISDATDRYYSRYMNSWMNQRLSAYLDVEIEMEAFWSSYFIQYIKDEQNSLNLFLKLIRCFFGEYHRDGK